MTNINVSYKLSDFIVDDSQTRIYERMGFVKLKSEEAGE